MRTFTRFTSIVFIALASLSYTAQATLMIELNTIFDETSTTLKPTPGGTAPWLTATFENNGSNKVRLTMESNLGGVDFVGGWYFNFNSDLDADDLTFARNNLLSTTSLDADEVNHGLNGDGNNAYKADGERDYDILFDFIPSNTIKFEGVSTLVYDISLTGLTESDFDFFGAGTADKGGPFTSAAHIQGLAGGLSTWIGGDGEIVCTDPNGCGGGGPQDIPEPSTLFLLGSALLAFSLRKKTA